MEGLFNTTSGSEGLSDKFSATPNALNVTTPDLNVVSILLTIGLILIVVMGVAFLVVAIGSILVALYRHRNREKTSLDMICLQVAVPRDNEIKVDAMEQVFSSLYSIKKGGRGWFGLLNWTVVQPHISFEIVAIKEDVRFYIVVPKKLQDLVEKQINGGFPGAEIKIVDEPTIFSQEGKVEYSWMVLRTAAYNPIQTYKNLATDSMSSLTSSLAKMEENEGAHIQILIWPADNKWKGKGRAWIGKTKKSESNPEKASYKVDAKVMEAVENKCSKSGFNASVRVVVSAPTGDKAKMHMGNIKAAFEQYSGDLNGFKGKKIRLKGLFMTDFIYRYQPMLRWGDWTVLNSEELATLYHFPNKTIETPHIHWLNAKSAPAPAQIPNEGLYLGRSVYRGITRPVYLSESDRERHMYIIGRTGVGKRNL